jgi:hypothetical protein
MIRFRAIVILSFGVLVGVGAKAADLSDPHIAAARSACAQMGLNTSEAPFVFCVRSLVDSAAAVDQASRVQEGRQQCFARGLRSGTAAFANCVLDAEQSTASSR